MLPKLLDPRPYFAHLPDPRRPAASPLPLKRLIPDQPLHQRRM